MEIYRLFSTVVALISIHLIKKLLDTTTHLPSGRNDWACEHKQTILTFYLMVALPCSAKFTVHHSQPTSSEWSSAAKSVSWETSKPIYIRTEHKPRENAPGKNSVALFTWYNFSFDQNMKRFELPLCNRIKLHLVWAFFFWLRCLYGTFFILCMLLNQ